MNSRAALTSSRVMLRVIFKRRINGVPAAKSPEDRGNQNRGAAHHGLAVADGRIDLEARRGGCLQLATGPPASCGSGGQVDRLSGRTLESHATFPAFLGTWNFSALGTSSLALHPPLMATADPRFKEFILFQAENAGLAVSREPRAIKRGSKVHPLRTSHQKVFKETPHRSRPRSSA